MELIGRDGLDLLLYPGELEDFLAIFDPRADALPRGMHNLLRDSRLEHITNGPSEICDVRRAAPVVTHEPQDGLRFSPLQDTGHKVLSARAIHP